MTDPDLQPLFARAFHEADAARANEALGEARDRFSSPTGKSFSYEVLVPPAPDRAWLIDRLLARLVYHCESSRSPLPGCQGVFVSFFAGERLYCVAAAEVVAWAGGLLGLTARQLVERFGTGEQREPVRAGEPPPALPPPAGEEG